MTTMASEITGLTVVYSTVYSDLDHRKHQSSASLAFVWGIHRDRGNLMTSSWRWSPKLVKWTIKWLEGWHAMAFFWCHCNAMYKIYHTQPVVQYYNNLISVLKCGSGWFPEGCIIQAMRSLVGSVVYMFGRWNEMFCHSYIAIVIRQIPVYSLD